MRAFSSLSFVFLLLRHNTIFLFRFQTFLDEMDGRISTSSPAVKNAGSRKSSIIASSGDNNGSAATGVIGAGNGVSSGNSPLRRSSVSDGAESLSRSASDSSVSKAHNANHNTMNTPLHGHG